MAFGAPAVPGDGFNPLRRYTPILLDALSLKGIMNP